MTERSIIHQTLFQQKHPPITIDTIHLGCLSEEVVDRFLASAESDIVGVSASYGSKFVVDALAFSTSVNVLYVNLGKHARQKKVGKQILCDALLCNASYKKYGFNMDRLASALHIDLDLSIQNAFDIQHLRFTRHSAAAILALLSGDKEDILKRAKVLEVFLSEKSTQSKEQLVLRAWGSFMATSHPTTRSTAPIDTRTPSKLVIQFLAKCVRDADRLDALKPAFVKNDIGADISNKNGFVNVQCTRFKTRMRVSGNQKVEFETRQGKVTGRTVKVEGKNARVIVPKEIGHGSILSVMTIGKEDPTTAESERSAIILNAFQGSKHLLSSAFVRTMFMPSLPPRDIIWPSSLPGSAPAVSFPFRELNDSQRAAVEFCLCQDAARRVGLILGPPGTGKTTVIAACVTSIVFGTTDDTVWIVAQSNVAVKNVAEKLADCGFFDFRVLVSKEFHFDWHEHLYEQIERNVIQSSQFQKGIGDNARLLGTARVMLCTISMLSNQRLHSGGFTQIVPLHTLIVDEASQIEVGDYLPLLSRFHSSLRKLVFIGDNKQLAPYGQEDIGNLRSVFEIPHLLKRALFLDTQYRMPVVIGNFISRHVYHGKLKTVHKITTNLCCRFVDVANGKERQFGSSSWENPAEIKVVVQIARRYLREGKAFRIITPYDGQRNAIEKELRNAGLRWEDTCFNVDSFQGNEEMHIIVSVVRSERPGFLKNERRMNVMLSRCKASMLICSSKSFLRGGNISSTLVGKLAKECMEISGSAAWISTKQINEGRW